LEDAIRSLPDDLKELLNTLRTMIDSPRIGTAPGSDKVARLLGAIAIALFLRSDEESTPPVTERASKAGLPESTPAPHQPVPADVPESEGEPSAPARTALFRSLVRKTVAEELARASEKKTGIDGEEIVEHTVFSPAEGGSQVHLRHASALIRTVPTLDPAVVARLAGTMMASTAAPKLMPRSKRRAKSKAATDALLSAWMALIGWDDGQASRPEYGSDRGGSVRD
jgi:hypothetical protein